MLLKEVHMFPGRLSAILKYLFAMAAITLAGVSLGAHSIKAEPAERLPDVTLIYDLSNSMWAPLEGTAKVTHAQNGLAEGLKGLEGQINFSLLSFGHKEKTGCENIEQMVEHDRLDENSVKLAIKPLRPRGNAPIAKALLNAANLASNRAAPYTIILLADGASNCPTDPCKTAAKLKGAMPGLIIDVITIGQLNGKPLSGLQCIAKPTGGIITAAMNGKDIAALIKGSVKRAIERKAEFEARGNTPPAVAADPTGDEQQDWAGATEIIVTPKEKDVTGALEEEQAEGQFNKADEELRKTHGGLALMAHLVDKGKPIKSGLIWRIYTEKPDKSTGKHKLISAHKSSSPVMSLPKGKYLINAAYGRAFLTRKVNINAGENATEHFILNAGGLKISSVLANGNPVPENTVIYDIYADERDQFGKRLSVINKVRPGLVVRLNAGIYHIVSTYGDANAQSRADVSVEAGKLTEATIDHQAAKVTFKLVYQKGGEALADTRWSLLSPAGKVIKKSAGALPTHFLAAGDYTVLAERGAKKYTEHFSVTAGDTRQIEVIIQ